MRTDRAQLDVSSSRLWDGLERDDEDECEYEDETSRGARATQLLTEHERVSG